MTEKPENSGEKQGGRFRPGQSGNPTGKPPGARHKATQLAEKLMEADAGEVVNAVITAAKGGDMTAARLILDRIAPVRKGRPINLELPEMADAAGVLAGLGATVKAMGEGHATPDEAATVAGVLEMKRRALETADLATQIEELKAHVGLIPQA